MRINIAHSEYSEQRGGLMICGYEWGYSKEDQRAEQQSRTEPARMDVECTFANKDARFGAPALKWKYDSRIREWFRIWGHPLNHSTPGQFERSIVQTNWCDSMNHSMDGDYSKLLAPENAQNFVAHVRHFSPSVILLMGSQLFPAFQNASMFGDVIEVLGEPVASPVVVQKPFEGRRFNVTFQAFANSEVICLPHPSSSRGLSHAYIGMFSPEVGGIISRYKNLRGC